MAGHVFLAYLVPMAKRKVPEHVREAMRWLSKQGASKGGKARWKGVSAAERSAYAKKMIEAREAKRKRST